MTDEGPPSPEDRLSAALGILDRDARTVVLLVESEDGDVGALLDSLPPDRPLAGRVRATEASRAEVGSIAERLDLTGLAPGDVAVIEDAQWADPSSLGRVQRTIRQGKAGLLILGRRPEEESWALDRVVETARRTDALVSVALETGRRMVVDDPDDRDLAIAAGMVSHPLTVEVIARLLDVPEGEALRRAEALVESGVLQQSASGFCAGAPVEAGEARRGHVAGRLASALEVAGASPAVVGTLRARAGDPAGAYPLLTEAARRASSRGALGEAGWLAGAALEAGKQAGVASREATGDLHLIAGRFLRSAGRSELAAAHLDQATAALDGPARIDALGFAAAVADDRQRPQEAERILAMAELEATRQGETAKRGSIATFRARALNRLGFAQESDALLEKGLAWLAGGTSAQKRNAETNRAWMLFDRGQAGRAEMEFTRLRDLTDPANDAEMADREAWRARALFASGRPDEAQAAVAQAVELAGRAGVEAPLFLADLALMEAGLLYGRYEEALAARERALDLVEAQLGAWENVVRSQGALLHLRRGDVEEARREIDQATRATPDGADGWRLRSRCEAISLEVGAAEGNWDGSRAVDLADALLQAEYYGWAAELLCVVAERDDDPDAAREAMALALQVGNPMLAARSASAGNFWDDPGVTPVVRAIRAVSERLPDTWSESWNQVAGVSEALAAPEPADEGGGDANLEFLDRALRRAGLAGADMVLSPAQRRKQGLVRPRRRRRRWSPVQMVAAGLGVIVVAAGTSVAVGSLTADPPAVTVVREVVTPTASAEPLGLEETQIPGPAEDLTGLAPFRGGPARTGVAEASGVRSVDGYLWTYETAGPIEATPVAYGRNLIIPSTDGTVYALDLTTGARIWTLRTEGRITTAPDVGQAALGEGQSPALVVIAGDDGTVRARDALRDLETERWSTALDARIAASPVIAEGVVFVATRDGRVHALDLASGEPVWQYPAEGEGIGTVSADLAVSEGVLYVGSEEGTFHLIEAASGTALCQVDLATAIVASPIVSEGAVLIPTRGNTIFMRPAGECNQGSVDGRLPLYGTETAVEVPPAVTSDRMYLPSGRFLYSIGLGDNQHQWSASTVDAGSPILGAPVVADGVVYFGTEEGLAIAVDGDTGEELWRWQTGNFVRASPVVIDGAVFVASGDGRVYALSGD
ncbi:MAG TPA: PQQ-binding-like beta-propeller repeat protein [Acidimicrobiia bacterium]|nr:PQQ-binding-like beta-propeller repeat protein [Acidimicrobiia bacterium]